MVSVGSVWVKLGIKSTLGADVAKADAALGKLRKSAKNTAANFKAVGQSMTMYVGAPLSIIGGLATKTAVDFDDAMRQVQAVTGATGEDFQDLTDLARDLGATTSFSAKQAAEGMLFLGRAGFSVTQIMGSLEDTLSLARATGTDLGQTADIMSNIMKAFRIPAEDAGRAVDVLAATTASANTDLIQLGDAMKYVAPVGVQMGLSLEDTAAAAGFLSNVGLQATLAGTGLRGMLMSMAAPTGTAKSALEKYGLAIEDVNPVTHDLVEVLNTLNNAGVGITDTMRIFGLRAGPGTAALLAEGGDSLSAYIGVLENADGTAAKMAKTMDEGPGGSIRMLKSALEGLKIEFGTIIAEGLMPVSEAAKWVANAFANLPGPVKKGVVALGGLAIAASALVLAVGVLTPLVGTGGLIATGLSTVAGVASAAAWAIFAINPIVLGVAGGLIYLEKKFSLVSDTLTITAEAFKVVGKLISEKITATFERLQPRLDWARESLENLMEGMIELSGPVGTGLKTFLDDWHQRAEDIRKKNEELALSNKIVADSTRAEAQSFNELGEAISGVSAEIPGYAGHTRELIEAGMPEQAGFVEGLQGKTKLPGVQAPPPPTIDFRQFATMGQQPFQGLDISAIQPPAKTEENKKIEENTKDTVTEIKELGNLETVLFSNLEKAITKQKPTDFAGFFRSSPT